MTLSSSVCSSQTPGRSSPAGRTKSARTRRTNASNVGSVGLARSAENTPKGSEGTGDSRAEAGSLSPPGPTAPGRSDNTAHSAASPDLGGQRACSWPRTELRSSHRSLEEMAEGGSARWGGGGVCCSRAYIYNRKTGGSDTWWPQTSPRRSPPRWESGSPHTRPYSSGRPCRDLREEAEMRGANRVSVCRTGVWKRPHLTCQRGIEVFELQDLVGPLTSCHAAVVYFKIVRQRFLHAPGTVAEVSAVVESHALYENTLGNNPNNNSVSVRLELRRSHWGGGRVHTPRTAAPRGRSGTPPRPAEICSSSCSWPA